MSVIERIFRGNYRPADVIKPDTEAFRAAEKKAFEISDKLEDTLSEEQKVLWNDFLAYYSDTQEMYTFESYREGVTFGVNLMLELLKA